MRLNESYMCLIIIIEAVISGYEGKAERIILTSDRNSSKTLLCLDIPNIANGVLGAHDDRIQNESVLILLDLLDHLGLVFSGAVVVNETDTTQKCHEDGHLVLGDSVHGRRHQRQID
jgi:hypothetical protein